MLTQLHAFALQLQRQFFSIEAIDTHLKLSALCFGLSVFQYYSKNFFFSFLISSLVNPIWVLR
jgi:hypothetical protein